MGKHHDFGKQGEDKAADYLMREGYEILARNFRFKKAEIDIIALKDNVVCIVEVKARSSEEFEAITDTVKPAKIKLLVTAADEFIVKNDLDHEVRFDLITILKKGKGLILEHIPNAFYHF